MFKKFFGGKSTLLGSVLAILLFTPSFAQRRTPYNSTSDVRDAVYVFKNATVWLDYKTKKEGYTLVVKNGKIEAAGPNVAVPKAAQLIDLTGKHIYPSFIDLYSEYGMPQAQQSPRAFRAQGPQPESKKKGAFHQNQAIRPEISAAELFNTNPTDAEKWRESGFGAVLTAWHDGIASGTSVLVRLADKRENELILKEKAAAHFSFNKGSSTQDYPSSLMGAVALLRQTFLDAAYYKSLKNPEEYNLSLEAWNQQADLPKIFETESALSVLTADRTGDEFGVQYIIKGRGDEYRILRELKASGASLIVPVSFPEAYDVEDPWDASQVTFAEMKHWELAPANAAKLAEAGIPFALTTSDLKDKQDFRKNLLKCIRHGLRKEEALKALTYTPAKLLGMEKTLGGLAPGMQANFLIASGDLFDEETILYENVVGGERYVINDLQLADLRGTYNVAFVDGMPPMKLEIGGDALKPDFDLKLNDTVSAAQVKGSRSGNFITLSFDLSKDRSAGLIRLSGYFKNDSIVGQAQMPSGNSLTYRAVRTKLYQDLKTKKDSVDAPETTGDLLYPLSAYGRKNIPEAKTYLIRGAVVWTNESEGILPQADVVMKNGKILRVGTNLSEPGAEVVEAKGKHLTSGIIDEHSHIAIRGGVNEGTESVTAEVRIGDALDPTDVNIYRQLAGGTTAAQLLHGSANPIGGQSALIKLRWGRSAEELKIEGADPFIKFALGENVKQSNWGDLYTTRFPQTRAGVEQVFADAFTRAQAYKQAREAAGTKRKGVGRPFRRDLESEALAEILDEKRFITCHSYVKSEILMLMRLAERFGFRVNTFTHILEGYKLADKMKKHGVGASTFSDWWAYKFEVKDAIPYNAALLHKMGVVTAINSDDAEMGSRLNQEAAKTVKYGGLSEEDAWKTVTLNPAKLLHLDKRMGSIKPGKDADLVLWSDHPLSEYARAEKTFVDGALYYDAGEDARLRTAMHDERARIIQKMLNAKKKGEPVQKPQPKKERLWHCDDLENDDLFTEQ